MMAVDSDSSLNSSPRTSLQAGNLALNAGESPTRLFTRKDARNSTISLDGSSVHSGSTNVAIPSRTSSVMMGSSGPIPNRSSSISSPTKSSHSPLKTGLPSADSDLANTIAGLCLADDNDLDRSATTQGTTTPQASSHFFQSITTTKSPHLYGSPAKLESLSSIHLGQGIQDSTVSEISEEINQVEQTIPDIKRHIFRIQEKRHAGHFTNCNNTTDSSSQPSSSGESPATPLGNGQDAGKSTLERSSSEELPASELDLALMQLDEKLESVSRSMQKLEVQIGEICAQEDEEEDADSSIVDKEISAWKSRERRNSVGSITSFTSFDEAMLPSFAPSLTPKALKTKYDDLVEEWNKVQQEAESLKKELGDDKYLVVFRSVSEQADSMMDSLDKAICQCQGFISQFNTDYQAGIVRPNGRPGATDPACFDVDYELPAKLEELADIKKVFSVKKSYYTPACDQVFNVLERGTRERGASNGTILRRLADLKSRWKLMRQTMSRTEKEMKRIEAWLAHLQSGSNESAAAIGGHRASSVASPAALPSNPTSKRLPNTSLGLGTPTRPSTMPKNPQRTSVIVARVASGPSQMPSSSSAGSNLANAGNSAPALPPKSRLRRISATAESLGLQTKPIATPPRGSSRLIETPRSLRIHRSQDRLSMNEPITMADLPRQRKASSPSDTRSTQSPSRPAAMSGRPMFGRTTPTAEIGTPGRHPPSSFRASWFGLEGVGRARSKTPQPQSSRQDETGPPTPTHVQRPSSRASVTGRSAQAVSHQYESDAGDDAMEWVHSLEDSSGRPGSSAGFYYRPPSAQGNIGEPKNRKRDSMIPRLTVRPNENSGSPSRPGSALSQASTSPYGGQNALTPPRYNGASRLTMQTPEPTIAARAQRLSMYARAPSTGVSGMGTPSSTASKRASRPPPARLNNSLMSSRTASSAGGRTTPLSAAALALIPTAEPGSSLSRSSVATNLRSGRTTPTFSDAGSVGGMSNGTWYGGGGASGGGYRLGSGSVAGSNYGGAGGHIEQYKPNPNDALDVEVARICNGLGVSLERVDPPLPRGVKLEEGPGQDNRARYDVGGKIVACRLLELHRPAGSAGARAGTKAKKILVRIGGGWQDLEQWVLNCMSQQ